MIHPLVLLTAVLHTLLLLVHLYSCAFRRLGRGLPLSPADLALLIVQTAALTLLRAAGDDPLSAPGMVVQLLLLILCALAVVLELRRSRACGGELLPQSVREAIDSLPDGLCFAAPDGRPILVNTRMHALIAGLTGAALLDANAVWSRLKELAQPADPWTAQVEGEVLDLLCPDGSRWRFRRELLRDRLPLKGRQGLEILVTIVWIAFGLFVMYMGIEAVTMIATYGQRSSALRIPMQFCYLSIPVGMGLMILRLIGSLIGQFKNFGKSEEGKAA